MRVKCVVELEHDGDCGDFDVKSFAENLKDFIKDNEQSCMDKAEIQVLTPYSSVYLGVGE